MYVMFRSAALIVFSFSLSLLRRYTSIGPVRMLRVKRKLVNRFFLNVVVTIPCTLSQPLKLLNITTECVI